MSTRTTNLNLIKPELTDNIAQSIADFNTNSDILDSAVYKKPDGGIPSTDLASAVQTSLGKADTALQEHQSLSAYRTSVNQDAIDATLQPKTDNTLTTTAQTIVGAINEHESNISQLNDVKLNKSDIVDDLITDSSTKILSAKQGKILNDIKADLSVLISHTSNSSNPHIVTKVQVGLGNCDNTSDTNKPISTATQTALNNKADASTLTSHTGNKSNPHSVTKSQVGLGNVPNVATNDQTPTYSVASTLATLTSGEKLSVSFGKIMKAITDFISHKGSTSNPHSVTKSQVGLGNVGNFKSVSTVASQGLTSTEQSNARANIGAGTSSLTIGTTSSTAAAGNHTHSYYTKPSSGIPKTDLASAVQTSLGKADSALQNVWTLVWTNASPTSDFAAQTLSLSLSAYSYIAIQTRHWKEYDYQIVFFCKVGSGAFLNFAESTPEGSDASTRYVLSTTTSKISFDNCEISSKGTQAKVVNNGSIVPMRIYGIK